jgi:hypothetical protein
MTNIRTRIRNVPEDFPKDKAFPRVIEPPQRR